MRKGIETETYRFIGDSKENMAVQMHNGKRIGTYTQTSIIKGLNANKHYVVGGKKLKTPIDNPRQTYLIYYGEDKEHIEQIIKITVDKRCLEKGDPNALAIDGMCASSINIRMKNWAVKALAVTSVVVMMTGLAYGMVKADEKETKMREQQMDSYFEWINEERAENGLPPLGEDYSEIELEGLGYQRGR